MIRFSSPAAADVLMLDEHAKRLLELIGKAPQRGAIAADEIPAALAALRDAIERERRAAPPADGDEDEDREHEDQPPPVDLARRAWPLMEMLEKAQRKGAAVSWGL